MDFVSENRDKILIYFIYKYLCLRNIMKENYGRAYEIKILPLTLIHNYFCQQRKML